MDHPHSLSLKQTELTIPMSNASPMSPPLPPTPSSGFSGFSDRRVRAGAIEEAVAYSMHQPTPPGGSSLMAGGQVSAAGVGGGSQIHHRSPTALNHNNESLASPVNPRSPRIISPNAAAQFWSSNSPVSPSHQQYQNALSPKSPRSIPSPKAHATASTIAPPPMPFSPVQSNYHSVQSNLHRTNEPMSAGGPSSHSQQFNAAAMRTRNISQPVRPTFLNDEQIGYGAGWNGVRGYQQGLQHPSSRPRNHSEPQPYQPDPRYHLQYSYYPPSRDAVESGMSFGSRSAGNSPRPMNLSTPGSPMTMQIMRGMPMTSGSGSPRPEVILAVSSAAYQQPHHEIEFVEAVHPPREYPDETSASRPSVVEADDASKSTPDSTNGPPGSVDLHRKGTAARFIARMRGDEDNRSDRSSPVPTLQTPFGHRRQESSDTSITNLGSDIETDPGKLSLTTRGYARRSDLTLDTGRRGVEWTPRRGVAMEMEDDDDDEDNQDENSDLADEAQDESTKTGQRGLTGDGRMSTVSVATDLSIESMYDGDMSRRPSVKRKASLAKSARGGIPQHAPNSAPVAASLTDPFGLDDARRLQTNAGAAPVGQPTESKWTTMSKRILEKAAQQAAEAKAVLDGARV
ncbi:hypothetical protein HDU97_007393 [Phlyctochytrium planicorne]|nr:hypothetical protein HDU97_007393 [Phlyctochytrium planicorne]